ncbi:cytosol aminopeptidase-like [Teleopsis dalmanni]|uniref:cytosol aminopeptidase-like n=1 Tax=Teleopsis dalmanni TaxID=139649 RepID=UPI0018CF5AB3|nr:cytosol aminopeptidase-like [Teleopsis dalmanni]
MSFKRCFGLVKSTFLRQIRFNSNDQSKHGFVIGIFEDDDSNSPKLTPIGEKVDDICSGGLSEIVNGCEITGQLSKGIILKNIHQEFKNIAIVGVGPEDIGLDECGMIDEGLENVRIAAGVGARCLQRHGCDVIFVDSMDFPQQAAVGSTLAMWQEKLDNMENTSLLPRIQFLDHNDEEEWRSGEFKAESQILSRFLTEILNSELTALNFLEGAVDILMRYGITVNTRSENWMKFTALNSFLRITNPISKEPPVILEASYWGTDPKERPVVLYAKGITFNADDDFHCCCYDKYCTSMAGAALVIAVLQASAGLRLPINLSVVIPLCSYTANMSHCTNIDNKPSNKTSFLISDPDRSGMKTLLYAQYAYKPRLIIDIRALEAEIDGTLEDGITGIFSNSCEMWKEFKIAGWITGNRMRRLPLWQLYDRVRFNNGIFQDTSIPNQQGFVHAISAKILNQFLPRIDWVQFGIYGEKMPGRSTLTLIQFLYQLTTLKP